MMGELLNSQLAPWGLPDIPCSGELEIALWNGWIPFLPSSWKWKIHPKWKETNIGGDQEGPIFQIHAYGRKGKWWNEQVGNIGDLVEMWKETHWVTNGNCDWGLWLVIGNKHTDTHTHMMINVMEVKNYFLTYSKFWKFAPCRGSHCTLLLAWCTRFAIEHVLDWFRVGVKGELTTALCR